MQSLREKEEG